MTERHLRPVSLKDHERMHAVEIIKLPPHSVECEQSVLGGLLLDNTAWDRIADLISESDFYRADHRLIWRHISALIEHSQPADVITVAERLGARNELDSAGGLAYLGALAQNTPTAANIRRYAEVVHDRAILRHVAAAATDIADLAWNPNGKTADEVLDRAESVMFGVAEKGAKASEGFIDMQPILTAVAAQIDMLYHRDNPGDILGVPSGLTDLDRQTSGFNPGDLVIIAARPSMGKTALAVTIAEYVGVHCNLPVGIFSMEMPKEQMGLRLLCVNGALHFHKVRKGLLHDDDWRRFTGAVGAINEAPIHIDETGAISPSEIRARCRRLYRQYGKLGLIIVDYLQLMGVAGLGDTRAGEIGVATRSLKALAKELNCPILALSQVNRSVESRPNKRPNMSDLRESGDIEQDADIVIFLYRDEVYHNDSPAKGKAELIIAKQRNGPICTVTATWQGEYMRFMNFADPGRF